MYNVSAGYKEDIEKRIRGRSYVRILFGITNPDAVAASSLSDNGHLSYSNTAQIDTGVMPTIPYATLEPGRWVLNGQSACPDLAHPTYQGYISAALSDAEGEWAISPEIVINFSEYLQFAGLSFQFDSFCGWYPSLFQVEAYNGASKVFNTTYMPNNEFFVLPDALPVCNRILLRWLKNDKPYSRARLMSLVYGVMERLTDKDIKECQCARHVDLLSTCYPKYNFDFTIFDPNGAYDPENPRGVWEYLETRQPVQCSIGYELENGVIEWMPWANTYTTGNVSVAGSGAALEVTIHSAGLINHLDATYDEGAYCITGRSLAALAGDVMGFAGFSGAIFVDEALNDIYTKMPLPVDTVANLLQLIANAGRCVLNVTRGGGITILRQSAEVENFTLNFAKMTSVPTTTKVPPLRNVNFTYGVVSVDETAKKVVDAVAVNGATGEVYTFSHSPVTNQSISVSGLSYSDAHFYANKTVVTLSGSGVITVYGNALVTSSRVYSKQFGQVGADLDTLVNVLITDEAQAAAYVDWVAEVTQRRNTYAVNERGYPELDTGDNIGFVSTYTSNITATQLESAITFDGAISSQSRYLIMNEEG